MKKPIKLILLCTVAVLCMAPGKCNRNSSGKKYHCVAISSNIPGDNGATAWLEVPVEEVSPHEYRFIKKRGTNSLRACLPNAKKDGAGECMTIPSDTRSTDDQRAAFLLPPHGTAYGWQPEDILHLPSPRTSKITWQYWKDGKMEIVPESEMPNMLGIDTSFSGRFMAHGGHHEKVGNNIINIQAGKIEVCRRAWVTLKDGSPTAFEKHIINYNTVFGDKSSRCTPAKISGPPTCGSL